MAYTITGIGPTAVRTYTFPDADATILTSITPVATTSYVRAGAADSTAPLAGDLVANRGGTPGTGAVFFGGSTNLHYLTYDGTKFILTDALTLSDVTSGIGWSARTTLKSPADAQLNLLNSAESAGVGIDVATDTVLKIRTRAQTGYATVDCLGLKASGVAGVSFGPAHPASITIVNGIVTAAS